MEKGSMNNGSSIKVESNQQELQACIYAVHEELRNKFKEIVNTGSDEGLCYETWLSAWKSHTENKDKLEEYSLAMYELATRIWDPRNRAEVLANNSIGIPNSSEIKCRIKWVMIQVGKYFGEAVSNSGTKLKLLDVGSCYNPFSKYDDILDIVAIDLCPAPPYRSVVYQADFLTIRISQDPAPLTTIAFEDTTKLISLSSNAFDLIVFSFFLEYLPDTRQRLESCNRAYKLLRPGGVLFILRPDSNSVTPWSMKLIKELKVGLGFLGFRRLWCDKLEHLWCMGFVKLTEEDKLIHINSTKFRSDSRKVGFLEIPNEEKLHKLFAIPQDFKDVVISKETNSDTAICAVPTDPLLFQELPIIIELE